MKKAFYCFLIGVAVFGIICARAFWSSKQEFQLGEIELSKSNHEEAILHFDRALHWYAPLNPYSREALSKLWTLAYDLEKQNPKTALLALDAARGGIRAIRSFYQPYSEWIVRINEQIAYLRAQEQVKLQPEKNLGEVLAWHRKILIKDERPQPFWVWVVQIGFWGWIGSTVGFIWKGFDPEGKMHLKPSMPWIAGMVILFGVWVLGLVSA